MTRAALTVACALSVLAAPAARADEKEPLELKLVLKKDKYDWPYDLAPADLEAKLKEAAKKKGAGLPRPPAVDLVLRITNAGKEKVTVYVNGDPNTYTLTLKGPGVQTATPLLAFTADFKFPKPIGLEPGKSHDVPVKALSDGFRGASRYVFPTAPGEYTLSATYQLSDRDGGKAAVLQGNEVKLTIEKPKE